jgi:two-component sensor histidine kinase
VPHLVTERDVARSGRVYSLPHWLVVLTAAVALPLLAFAAVAIWREHLGARHRTEDQLEMQARVLALAVDRELTQSAAAIRTLAASSALAAGNLEGFRAEMGGVAQQSPGAFIALADREGMLMLSTLVQPGVALPRYTPANAAVLPALGIGRPAISNLYRGPISHRLQVAVAVPVPGAHAGRGGTEGLPGAVTIALPRDTFINILGGQALPPGWVAWLVDRQNQVVARSDQPRGEELHTAPAEFIAAFTRSDVGVVAIVGTDGEAASVAFARSPVSGFVIGLAVPQRIFLAPLYRSLAQLAGFGLPVALGGIGFALLLGRRIVVAIQGLSLPARQARPGVRFREVEDIARRLDEAERWRVVLLAEMNHRVKNTLMTVQSLAVQTQKSHPDDPAQFQHAFAGRLATLARAHDLLTATAWQAVDTDVVLAAALAPWLDAPSHGVRLRIGSSFMVGPRQAQALVLALHELGTNAAKYGALSRPGGTVHIDCAMDEVSGMALIGWTEAGGPAVVAEPARRGFGSRLLEVLLPQDLGPGAVIERDFDTAGLRASIRFRPRAAAAPILGCTSGASL